MSRRGSGQGYRTRICSLTHTHLYIASSTRGPVTVLLTTSSSCMMMSEPGGGETEAPSLGKPSLPAGDKLDLRSAALGLAGFHTGP